MKNKVQIVEKQIMVNGVLSGWLEGSRSEVWVVLLKNPSLGKGWENRHSVARFKYFQVTAKAKKFIKKALESFSAEEVIEGCKASTPYEWAISKGIDYSTNPRK